MSKSGFRLEQVLGYRTELEKVHTLELVNARQEFEGACERIKLEEQNVNTLNNEYLDRQREGMSAMDLQLYADFFQRKSVDIKLQKLEADTLNDKVQEKQSILIQASMEKKALETLKEKKNQAHKQIMSEKERGFLEELSLRKKGQ